MWLIARLPFDDGAFDFALVAGALGLLPRPAKQAALTELVWISKSEVRLLEPVESKEGFYVQNTNL